MFDIYIFGCIVFLIIAPLIELFFIVIDFITGDRVFNKNMAKIDKTYRNRAKRWWLAYVLSAFLSWISVIWGLCAAVYRILALLRGLLRSYPEEIKKLRFPLLFNVELSAEQVWAHGYAILFKGGGVEVSKSCILEAFVIIKECNEDFDPIKALKSLDKLNVVEKETIDELKDHINKEKESMDNDTLYSE